MGRSGYVDDCDGLELWRGAVDSALRGKRGQAFLRELVTALDALPNKRLISGELVCEGECCALGAVALKRGKDVAGVDTYDRDELSDVFGIAPAMAAEIMWVNDERRTLSPEERFEAVRKWAAENIRLTPEEIVDAQ